MLDAKDHMGVSDRDLHARGDLLVVDHQVPIEQRALGAAVVAHLALQLFVSARPFGRGAGAVDRVFEKRGGIDGFLLTTPSTALPSELVRIGGRIAAKQATA